MRRVIAGAALTGLMVAVMYIRRGGFEMGGEWLIFPLMLGLDGAVDVAAELVSEVFGGGEE